MPRWRIALLAVLSHDAAGLLIALAVLAARGCWPVNWRPAGWRTALRGVGLAVLGSRWRRCGICGRLSRARHAAHRRAG
jgi:hypothetical protein